MVALLTRRLSRLGHAREHSTDDVYHENPEERVLVRTLRLGASVQVKTTKIVLRG